MMAATQHHQAARATPTECGCIRLHAQACDGQKAALHLLNDTSPTAPDTVVLGRALARAIRATTALKQACAGTNRGTT